MTISRDDIDRIYKAILPRLAQDFSSGGGVGASAPSPHDIAGEHHTGDLPPAIGHIVRIRGTNVALYPGNNNGLQRVNDVSYPEDVILVPPATFTISFEMGVGVKICGWSRWTTIFTGQVTGGMGGSLENLSIIRTADDGTTLKGIVSPSSGGGDKWLYVNSCNIKVTQSGSGDARAISAEANYSAVELWNSFMYGRSDGGNGYGTWRDLALVTAIEVYSSRIKGSDYHCNE